jgi:hypothetical protein
MQSRKSAVFAFNLAPDGMPDERTAGAYDAAQQIWVGAAASAASNPYIRRCVEVTRSGAYHWRHYTTRTRCVNDYQGFIENDYYVLAACVRTRTETFFLAWCVRKLP